MEASAQAMSDLRRILSEREPLYSKADASLETSGKPVQQSLDELQRRVSEAKGSKNLQAV